MLELLVAVLLTFYSSVFRIEKVNYIFGERQVKS